MNLPNPAPAAELAARLAVARAVSGDFARLTTDDHPDWYVWSFRLGNALRFLLRALDALTTAATGATGPAGVVVIAPGDLAALLTALSDATGYRMARGDDAAVRAYRRLAAALGTSTTN